MPNPIEYTEAQALLLEVAKTVEQECLPLECCYGRVLAEPLCAAQNVPPFDRSAYDGYAFRAGSVASASEQNPIRLRVIAEIPAGTAFCGTVPADAAVKILTGAPVPDGTDCVIKFELTEFDKNSVTVFSPVPRGANIVRAGEDVACGQLLARDGSVIDAGLAATLASQGVAAPTVYRRPRVGLLSTGSEVQEPTSPPIAGKIFNANRFAIEAELQKAGCETRYFGIAADCAETIAAQMEQALSQCDALITTGGVSVGDYDLTPDAMERIGAKILARGVRMKPGMACAYAVREGKLLFGLSGNPAAAMTQLVMIVMPALRKLAGRREVFAQEIDVTLADGFPKNSPLPRFLRGRLELRNGQAIMHLPSGQGNAVASSMIGSNVMALVPAGSGALEKNTRLKGFLI